MSYETLGIGVEDGIATLTVERPEKRNALSATLRRELAAAVDELAGDEGVRVAVLTGSGEEAFVAGADVEEFAARSPEEQREVMTSRTVYEAVAAFPKPLVAAIDGYCLGGGVELALACDIRVADATAVFGQPEIRLGLIPGAGGTQRMVRLVGAGQAARLALTGDFIDAAEAHRIGLVDLLVEEGEALRDAVGLARRIARWSPVATRLAKEAIRAAAERPLAEGLELEKELFLAAFGSEDGREGVRAFVEGREPDFRGR